MKRTIIFCLIGFLSLFILGIWLTYTYTSNQDNLIIDKLQTTIEEQNKKIDNLVLENSNLEMDLKKAVEKQDSITEISESWIKSICEMSSNGYFIDTYTAIAIYHNRLRTGFK